ncbi:ABC transporter ATP-binding protein [Paenibacillus radicis (ex Gao et al. 2016)]|uniref:Cobalt ABC transporter ATP-binding protein n=1 Tax=Paenibacillus radicis (ex Gao et al. 2016) TaxID=1737354 RepID=A0A917M7T9_9BACL|nr:ABC transporter ATP-binding protein [Paenibacillus radicis (ex Gao et al. 2016)]GGG83221.1 cobalt ABC transporter ATP-binding protein [Paenibacillus radicis (ex Gao et al. 2016)]
MIRFDNYSCRYESGKEPLLHTLNLQINPGEFVFVTGPSGGGKSTLCFSINGLIPNEMEGSLYEGSVTVDGINVQQTFPYDLVSVVGTVLQDPEWQLVRGTVKEELTFALENMGVPVEEIDRRLAQVAEQVQIKPLLLRSSLELSGGQKQRVAIAACLMMQPKVIVLDEPTAELDPMGKEMVMETICELHREWGYTVVFVDHNLDVTLPHASRVIVVANGRIIADAPPSRLFDQQAVRKLLPMPQVVHLSRQLGVRSPDGGDPLTVAELEEELARRLGTRAPLAGTNNEQLIRDEPARSGKPIIELKQVRFKYKKHDTDLTIKPVDLRIMQGEFTAIIGHNGAGKSTLCKLITGLLKPSSGEVLIHGKQANSYQAEQRVRHVGFVFQNPDFQFVRRTVYDEVAYGLHIQRLKAEEIDVRVRQVTKLLNIDNYLNEHPHFLSRGERRRVAIASILALEPEVIILDEPTTGLDSLRCQEMMSYIRKLWQKGHTIILLTHDMRVVADYVPRTIVMSGGQIQWDAPTRDIFAKKEELHRHQITLPPVVELSYALGWSVPSLTSEEFIAHMDREEGVIETAAEGVLR